MSEHIEALEVRAWRLEDQLNRLAGTQVNGMPTLGKATAALWWLGHREFRWAIENRLSENLATGGSALSSTEDFIPLDGAVLDVVVGEGMLGHECVRVSPDTARSRATGYGQAYSAVALGEPIAVKPWHIYTASIYTLMVPISLTPSRPNHMRITWFDAEGNEISVAEDGHHASKAEWNLSWITGPAPETAVTAQALLEFQHGAGEQFLVDKAIFYNGSDPQAWAYPEHSADQLEKGLRAHLNMKAGIFASEDFLSIDAVCSRLGGTLDLDAPMALAMIPTPNPNVVEAR